jgi:hypothetical protein
MYVRGYLQGNENGRVVTIEVLRPKTSKILFRPVIIFSFYLELCKNKCRNLIQTSKFKGSFRGLG